MSDSMVKYVASIFLQISLFKFVLALNTCFETITQKKDMFQPVNNVLSYPFFVHEIIWKPLSAHAVTIETYRLQHQ